MVRIKSAKHLAWADIVMVMKKNHAARINDLYRGKIDLPKIISLDIPDDYPVMDKTLIGLLNESVEDVLQNYRLPIT